MLGQRVKEAGAPDHEYRLAGLHQRTHRISGGHDLAAIGDPLLGQARSTRFAGLGGVVGAEQHPVAPCQQLADRLRGPLYGNLAAPHHSVEVDHPVGHGPTLAHHRELAADPCAVQT